MKDVEIREIIEKHQHWLRKDCNKWEDMRANLYGADLRGAHLWGVNLSGANLYGADLCGVDLCGAILYETNLDRTNLYRAVLWGANLCKANLNRANLCDSNLHEAILYKANFCEVDLHRADLGGADLRSAYLWKANLCGADLRGANLCGADLYEADLCGAKLSGTTNFYRAILQEAHNVPFIPYVCPDFGAFTGFKKAHGLIVVLEIPEDARRLSATGRKCRCDKAKVIDIQNIDGTKANVTSVPSNRDNNFIYKIGEEVCVLDFDEDRWNECSTGIHFFINRQEAVDYI